MTMRTLGSDGKYWPTAVQVVERIAELTQRAEAAEARANELAAQLATAQAIITKIALIVRSDADDNHLTDIESLPDNVKSLSDDFFSVNQELISARKELDKHEPIEWAGLTGFKP